MHIFRRVIWIIDNSTLLVFLFYHIYGSICANNSNGGGHHDIKCDEEFLLKKDCGNSCRLEGNFVSPNFPHNFPSGKYSCTFLIKTENLNYNYIQLYFVDFLLTPIGSDACETKVIIYEEKYPQHAQEYCGNSRPPFFETNTNRPTLIVEFVTTKNSNNNEITGIGFKARYKFSSTPTWAENPLVESLVLTKDNSIILMPKLNPFVSRQYRDFIWIIQVNTKYLVMLTVNELYVAESQNTDCLEVRDGLTSEDNLLGNLSTLKFKQISDASGYLLPSFLSSSNKMYVRFSSKMTTLYDILLVVYMSVLKDTYNTGPDLDPIDCEIKCNLEETKYCVINEDVICDQYIHCPSGEDEDLDCEKYHQCMSEGCKNDGTCWLDHECECPPGYSGNICQNENYSNEEISSYNSPILISALAATIVLLLLCACFIGIIIRRKSKLLWRNRRNQRSVRSLSNSISQGRGRAETDNSTSALEPIDILETEINGYLIFGAPPPYCESPPTYDNIMTSMD